jgi:hypothetical protein
LRRGAAPLSPDALNDPLGLDTTAAIFWLKNRQPEQWRDVKRQQIMEESVKRLISDEPLTDEE